MTSDAASVIGATAAPPLIAISGGEFVMGNDAGRPDERPMHRVWVAPFRAAVAPVTNEEYARFVAATAAPAPPFVGDERFSPPEQPVVGISWHDAVAYCAWLSAQTGIAFRLPTEAEREFAALGGRDRRDWPWAGEHHPLHDKLASLERPHAPSDACANGYGLLCMAENVHEWCSDWYDPTYYERSPEREPAGPETGVRRASRGGSWRHKIKFTRITARASLDPTFRYNDFGFRVYTAETQRRGGSS